VRHVGLPARTPITHILRMMDTIASCKGRFWLDGPRRREVAGRTSLGWCTPGAAPSPILCRLGADIVLGVETGSGLVSASVFFDRGLFVHKGLMLAPIEVSLSHYPGRKKLC
jgi:hypothetical protein